MPEVGGAAVTATPATANDRPSKVTRSPVWMPSASAKLRSTTTALCLTQLPSVSFGWSTEAGALSRPSATTASVWPWAPSTGKATGNGPLEPTIPGAWARCAMSSSPVSSVGGPLAPGKVAS